MYIALIMRMTAFWSSAKKLKVEAGGREWSMRGDVVDMTEEEWLEELEKHGQTPAEDPEEENEDSEDEDEMGQDVGEDPGPQ